MPQDFNIYRCGYRRKVRLVELDESSISLSSKGLPPFRIHPYSTPTGCNYYTGTEVATICRRSCGDGARGTLTSNSSASHDRSGFRRTMAPITRVTNLTPRTSCGLKFCVHMIYCSFFSYVPQTELPYHCSANQERRCQPSENP